VNIDKDKINNTDQIKLSVKVKNTGKMDGEEVVQMYVKDLESDKPMPVKQLRDFKRIFLKKGEEETIKSQLESFFYDI